MFTGRSLDKGVGRIVIQALLNIAAEGAIVSRHLLVCSGGGHLKQLDTLVDRMGIPASDQLWVTFDTGLSRTLLGDRDVIFAEYAAPRDAVKILKNANLARGILRGGHFETAISTGSSLAVSFLPLAARRGVPAHFIETAARATGPSLTGHILAKDKKVHTYTQYPVWADQRWRYRGSIFDNFEPGGSREVGDIRRAVVTVGTTESYGFDRLVRETGPVVGRLGCALADRQHRCLRLSHRGPGGGSAHRTG